MGELPVWFATAIVQKDGTFSVPRPPAASLGRINAITLRVTLGVPVFRTAFIPFEIARSKKLDIWMYVEKLPTAKGIKAGTVSQQMNDKDLPGNTTIAAGGPYGLNFSGSEDQVNTNFNISINADTSNNLTEFSDLIINGWNINVGWPTSWVESADGVLNRIKSAIASAGNSINEAVLEQMATILETDDRITKAMAMNFLFKDVSVTFYSVGYPNKDSWGTGNTTDKTVLIVAHPYIGFLRKF